MRGGRRAAAVLAVIALAASACTGGDDDAEPEETTPTTVAVEADESTTDTAQEEPTAPAGFNPEVVEAHSYDFEAAPGSEWSSTEIAASPGGDRSFLGPFSGDEVRLLLEGLPLHDSVAVSFDLYVIGPGWDNGTPGGRTWRMRVDDQALVSTGFSNTIGGRQHYPFNGPLINEALAGAVEQGSLGFDTAGAESVSDAVYRVERTVLHGAEALELSFSAQPGNGQPGPPWSWGIDNLVVEIQLSGERIVATDLSYASSGGQVSVSGSVPSEEERLAVEQILQRSFNERLGAVDLAVVAGPTPSWLARFNEVIQVLGPSDDLSARLTESTVEVSGAVRTEDWAQRANERLGVLLGPDVALTYDVDTLLAPSVETELEGLRVLFASGDSTLDATGEAVLDEVVALLAAHDDLIVTIEGHTDSVGERQTNADLGQARARVAGDYLLAAGVGPDRLRSRGFADFRPEVRDETSDADRAQNRRVQFVITPG